MLVEFSAGLKTYEGLETQYLQLFDARRVFSWAGNIRGILGQVWYLIVSIPDLCTLTYSVNTTTTCTNPWLQNGRIIKKKDTEYCNNTRTKDNLPHE